MHDPFRGRALRQAIDILISRLTDANEAYRRDRRLGASFAAIALGQFTDYLDARQSARGGAYLGLQQPMNDLCSALMSLQDGVVDPLFEPVPTRRGVLRDDGELARGKKPGLPEHTLQIRSFLAGCMQAAMDAGLKRNAAAEFVAKCAKEHPALRTMKGRPELAIARWRAEAMEAGSQRELGELPHNATSAERAAGRYNYQVRSLSGIRAGNGWSGKEQLAFLEKLIATSPELRGRDDAILRNGPGESENG